MLNLPDFPIDMNFPGSFQDCHQCSSKGVLQAIAACLMHMPAHHRSGNAATLFCSLICLQKVGISGGRLYLSVQFLLCHHPEQ